MMLASRRADSVLCRDGKAFLMMNKLPKKPLNTPKQPQLVQTQKVCLILSQFFLKAEVIYNH